MSKYEIIRNGAEIMIRDTEEDKFFGGYDFMGSVDWYDEIEPACILSEEDDPEQIVADLEAADEEAAPELEIAPRLYTEDEIRRERIRWNLDLIDRLEPGKADWCRAEAKALFHRATVNAWTDADGKIPSLDSWLDTVAETTRIELECWQARRCAELGEC